MSSLDKTEIDKTTFNFPFRGEIVSWTPILEYGDRILCRADSGVTALFVPEHIRRIQLLELLSRRHSLKGEVVSLRGGSGELSM